MSTLLLDTHAYVWAITAPDRLTDRAQSAVGDLANRLVLSAASSWEMAIKHHAGRWPEAEPLLARHEDLLHRLGGEELAITSRDARRAGGLSWEHADPFDRMLAAQALRIDAALVTADPVFHEVPGVPVLW